MSKNGDYASHCRNCGKQNSLQKPKGKVSVIHRSGDGDNLTTNDINSMAIDQQLARKEKELTVLKLKKLQQSCIEVAPENPAQVQTLNISMGLLAYADIVAGGVPVKWNAGHLHFSCASLANGRHQEEAIDTP